MYKKTANAIIQIKREFAHSYTGRAHIQEVLPEPSSTGEFSGMRTSLDALHAFARCSPIYHDSFEKKICGIRCTIYEGDINEYWLGSIKHSSSCQPFYPTWLVSAMIIAHTIRESGCTELVDIGSGDGRIAFCGALLGMRTVSIEIDDDLIRMQRQISKDTGIDFGPACMDALEADYQKMGLKRPAFVVGGLPQMGGEMLADGLLSKIYPRQKSAHSKSDDQFGDAAGMDAGESENDDTPDFSHLIVLAGEGEKSGPAAGYRKTKVLGGWGGLVRQYGLRTLCVTRLPTVWTFDVDDETPYVFAGLAGETSKT